MNSTTPGSEIEPLVEHARELRVRLNDELPNGVGNTIDALCDALAATRTPEAAQLEDGTLYAWTSAGDYELYPQYLNVSRRGGKIIVTVRGVEYRDELTPQNMDDNWLKPGILATMTLPDAEAQNLAAALAQVRHPSGERK